MSAVQEVNSEDHTMTAEDVESGSEGNDTDSSDNADSAPAVTQEVVTYDLGNLSCVDTTEIRKVPKQSLHETICFAAIAGTQKLMDRIFQLPSRVVQGTTGRIVTLPKPSTHLPREKPLPKPKEKTKWEKFAELKGIQNRKKSAKVFDEATETYKRRFGYDKANDEMKDWAIEHKGPVTIGADGMTEDPFTQRLQAKKERVAKNKKQQERNLERAGGKRVPGTIDLKSAVNPAQGKKGQKKGPKHQNHVDVALAITQRATASMGKFDKTRYGETAPKPLAMPSTTQNEGRSLNEEKAHSLKMLDRLLGKPSESEQMAPISTPSNRKRKKPSTGLEGGSHGARGGRGGRGARGGRGGGHGHGHGRGRGRGR